MAEETVYRTFIDREKDRVVTCVLHDNSITKTTLDCLILPLEIARASILNTNPSFDVTVIDLELERIANEPIEE